MAEIFGRLPMEFGGAFAADAALVTFGTSTAAIAGVGLLTQQVGWQYQQPITRIYEVGTRKTYYVIGRPQGNATMARILGPRPVALGFYAAYGNACNAGSNTLNFTTAAGCDPGNALAGTGFGLSMTGVALQAIAGSVRAEDMVVNEQLSLMFVSMLV